jgi:hypothetical protein
MTGVPDSWISTSEFRLPGTIFVIVPLSLLRALIFMALP